MFHADIVLYYPTVLVTVQKTHKTSTNITQCCTVSYCTYELLTKRKVKMAGYWPSSFFACLFVSVHKHVQRKTEANIQPP